MKAAAIWCFLAVLATGSASTLSPITRVVNLMKDLQKQSVKEGKAEEDVWESYECWAKKLIKTKTESNAAAASRVESLTNFIADAKEAARADSMNAGASAIDELSTDAQAATEMRKKENQDFEAGKQEMTKAVTALKSARQTLGLATAAHKTGTLLAVRSSLSHGVIALQQHQLVLKQAAEIGERFLDKADSVFLRRLLTGDVNPNYKKLAKIKGAGIKMKYKARSFKIQSVLAKMQKTFEANLAEAQKKEDKSKAIYDKFYAGFFGDAVTKEGTKTASVNVEKQKLMDYKVSSANSGQAWSEAEVEKKSLVDQIPVDEKIIAATNIKLVNTKNEYRKRIALRAQEGEAISKAISILDSDAAHATMSNSFSSQGFLFLQTAQKKSSSGAAEAILRKAALKSGSQKLLSVAADVRDESESTFKADGMKVIIAKIDVLIKKMAIDEKTDLDTVQDCEKNRMQQGRIAAVNARIADGISDDITTLKQQEADLKKDVKDLKTNVKDAKEEKATAKAQRAKELKAFKASQIEDTKAAGLVNQAKQTLKAFYAKQPVFFVQGETSMMALVRKAGSAEARDGRATQEPNGFDNKQVVHSESTGVITMLTMIANDINADKAEALRDEQKAVSAFKTFNKEQDAQIVIWREKIITKDAQIGVNTAGQVEKKGLRTAAKDNVALASKVIEKATEACDFFALNYKPRLKKRVVELTGLRQAKAALSGSKFKLLQEDDDDVGYDW